MAKSGNTSRDDSASGASLNTVAPAASNDPDSTQLLTALRIIQSESHRRGEKVLAETYRESYPALKQDPQAFLQILANEIALRVASGDLPSLEEYLKRFPEHEAWLRQQFALPQENGSSLNADPVSGSAASPDGSLLTRVNPIKVPPRRDESPTPKQPSPKAPLGGTVPNLPRGVANDGPATPKEGSPSPGKGTRPDAKDRGTLASIPGYEILGELGRGGM